MAQRIDPSTEAQGAGGLGRGVLLIVLWGAVLGVAYNYLGLQGAGWGIAWIGENPADMPELETLAGGNPPAEPAPSASRFLSDDPMGLPGPGAAATDGLPQIPDLGRPIQMQLPAVRRFFDAGAALLVDAREREEYVAGHIRGAINLPYDEVITDPVRLESLDTGGRPIITYCGGGACEVSISLAHELIRVGHRRVLVFMGGYPEWAAAGYPIATAEGG